MNEHEIAFIIASNDAVYYEECAYYIKRLNVPQGFRINIICISDASNIAEAYNRGLNTSNAKYKVYIHQDVFILNQNFIHEFLSIFKADSEIGLVGVIGGVALPDNGIIWDSWNVGKTYVCNYKAAYSIELYQDKDCAFLPVEAVDGMLMATQYDIRWREDLEYGWDFYDVSQSLEFRRRGYQVVVPYQETPWCYHDCGHTNLMQYDQAREKILKEYSDYFKGPYVKQYDTELWGLNHQLSNVTKDFLVTGQYHQILNIMTQYVYSNVTSNDLIYIYNLMDIYVGEERQGLSEQGFLNNLHTWEQIKDKYKQTIIMLRRLETDILDENEKKELVQILINKKISEVAIDEILNHNMIYVEKVKNIFRQYK